MYCKICSEKKKLPIPDFCDYSFCSCDRWEEKDYWDDLFCSNCAEESDICQKCGEKL